MTKITITLDIDNEFRVPGPDGSEAGSYYTDDREDALYTAAHLFGGIPRNQFRFKRVTTHPQGDS